MSTIPFNHRLRIYPNLPINKVYLQWFKTLTDDDIPDGPVPLMITELVKYVYWCFYGLEYFKYCSANMIKNKHNSIVCSDVENVEQWMISDNVKNSLNISDDYVTWNRFDSDHFAVGNHQILSTKPSISQWKLVLGGNGNYFRYGGASIGIISACNFIEHSQILRGNPWDNTSPNYLVQANGLVFRNGSTGFRTSTHFVYPFKNGDEIKLILNTDLKVIKMQVNTCPMMYIATNIPTGNEIKYRLAVRLRNLYMSITLKDFITYDIV